MANKLLAGDGHWCKGVILPYAMYQHGGWVYMVAHDHGRDLDSFMVEECVAVVDNETALLNVARTLGVIFDLLGSLKGLHDLVRRGVGGSTSGRVPCRVLWLELTTGGRGAWTLSDDGRDSYQGSRRSSFAGHGASHADTGSAYPGHSMKR